jgi:predicted RNA-binding protein
MRGGIVKVVVQREDWKLKEEEKPNIGAVETVKDLTDSEQTKIYDKNKDMQDQIIQGTETVTDVDPVVKETDTTQSDICQNDPYLKVEKLSLYQQVILPCYPIYY